MHSAGEVGCRKGVGGATATARRCTTMLRELEHTHTRTLPFFLVTISRLHVNPFQCAWIRDAAPPSFAVCSAISFCGTEGQASGAMAYARCQQRARGCSRAWAITTHAGTRARCSHGQQVGPTRHLAGRNAVVCDACTCACVASHEHEHTYVSDFLDGCLFLRLSCQVPIYTPKVLRQLR